MVDDEHEIRLWHRLQYENNVVLKKLIINVKWYHAGQQKLRYDFNTIMVYVYAMKGKQAEAAIAGVESQKMSFN